MKNSLSGLSDLEPTKTPASKRAKGKKVKWRKGKSLSEGSKAWKLGVRGGSGEGKTTTVFHVATEQIELAAKDDEHIRDIFSFNPPLRDALLKSNEETRRTALLEAHMFIFLDFDKGADLAFKAKQCNKIIIDKCFNYIGIDDWEDAYSALQEGLEMAAEHEKVWGNRGIWFIVDNLNKAWDSVQEDYIKAQYGLDMNTLLAEIRMNNPGRSREALRAQSQQISEKKEWSVINAAFHAEWLNRMKDSEYNVLFLSPSKNRPKDVRQSNGDVVEEQVPTLGGSKHCEFAVDWIIRKYKDEHGNYWAEVNKTRGIDFDENIMTEQISNPIFGPIKKEIYRIENLHAAKKEREYSKRSYLAKLPSLDAIAQIAPIMDLEEDPLAIIDVKEPEMSLDLELDLSFDEPEPEENPLQVIPATKSGVISFDESISGPTPEEHAKATTNSGPLYYIKPDKTGKYHLKGQGCALGKRIHQAIEITDVTGLSPCKRCVDHKYTKDYESKKDPLSDMPEW